MVDTLRSLSALKRFPIGPLIGVFAILAIWSMSSSVTAVARVPKITGLRADLAGKRAAMAGYRVAVEINDAGGVRGSVVGQRPRPGSFLEQGAIITAVITRGARQVLVPNVTDLPVDDARVEIERSGLRLGNVIYRAFARREPGRVVSTTPRAGRRTDAWTRVDIVAVLPR